MSRRNPRLILDLQLRASGVLLLAIGIWLFRLLYLGDHATAGPNATLGEMVLTAIGFLCLSAGAALAAVGAGLLDPVEISERWVRRSVDRVALDAGGPADETAHDPRPGQRSGS